MARMSIPECKKFIKIGNKIKTNANGAGVLSEGETIEGKVMKIEGSCFYITGTYDKPEEGVHGVSKWWVAFGNKGAWIEVEGKASPETYSSIIKELRIGVENGF